MVEIFGKHVPRFEKSKDAKMLQTASTEAGASALISSAISEIVIWAKFGRVVVDMSVSRAGYFSR